jgi:hypothetical protein
MTNSADLAAQVQQLQQQVAILQQQVSELMADPAPAEPRFAVELNRVYESPTVGYVSVSATDGRTGRVQLRVGDDGAITDYVGTAHSNGRPYLGALIRQGESFVLDAGGKRPAFESMFTPLF